MAPIFAESIKNKDNRLFVETLSKLAKNFGLEVVAEMVDSEEEIEVLQNLGVDYLQGFHLGRPIIDKCWQ